LHVEAEGEERREEKRREEKRREEKSSVSWSPYRGPKFF